MTEAKNDSAPASARVHRDEWGVPHIYADNERALFYAIGYAQADDRLERLLRHQLWMDGRLASAFGPEAVNEDIMTRRWRHADASRRGFEELDPAVQDAYRAFIEGAEQYMAEHPDEVPAWAPQLQPWLPIALNRAILWGYAILDAVRACHRGGGTIDSTAAADLTAVLLPRASNEWVVMPWRTASGATALLSDPHGTIGGMMDMFEMVYEAGALAGVGACLVGAPIPLLGHTHHVAWGMTTGAPSVSDCYVVEVDEDERRYRFEGEWRDFGVRRETIEVADGEPVEVEFRFTDHNSLESPIIGRSEGRVYVVSTPYMEVAGPLDEQLYGFQLATSVDEVRTAMKPLGMFSQNVMVADVHGHAWYVRAGRVPRRRPGIDWRHPVDGSTSATAWDGLHPLEDLVQAGDPECGFMQNNNVSPDTMTPETGGTSLDASRYLDYIFNDRPGRDNSRGRRIIELFESTTQATVDDLTEWALDVKWHGVERWKEALAAAVRHQATREGPPTRAFLRFIDQIARFDGMAVPESTGALAYLAWRTTIANWKPASAEDIDVLVDAVDAGAAITQDQEQLLLDAAERAAGFLTQNFGRADVPLGHMFRIGEPGDSLPCGGPAVLTRRVPERAELDPTVDRAVAPLRVMGFGPRQDDSRQYVVSGGRSLRLTILGKPITSFSVILWGQSGKPGSPHQRDQQRLTSEGRLRRIRLDEQELLREATVTTLTLTPPSPPTRD